MKALNLSIFVVFVLFTFASCDYKNVYEKNAPIPGGSWQNKNVLRFWYDVKDTLTVMNISINLRHTGLYKYSNLYLFVTTEAPNGKTHRDTLEFILADNKGKWFGRGVGDLYDIRMKYRNNTRFSQHGRYYFLIEQAMRDEKLEQVIDVGMRIEPAH